MLLSLSSGGLIAETLSKRFQKLGGGWMRPLAASFKGDQSDPSKSQLVTAAQGVLLVQGTTLNASTRL